MLWCLFGYLKSLASRRVGEEDAYTGGRNGSCAKGRWGERWCPETRPAWAEGQWLNWEAARTLRDAAASTDGDTGKKLYRQLTEYNGVLQCVIIIIKTRESTSYCKSCKCFTIITGKIYKVFMQTT